VLRNNGDVKLGRSYEKRRGITESEIGVEYRTPPPPKKKKVSNWIAHILRRNCLLYDVIEVKIEGRMEMTEIRGRRCKQLLEDLLEIGRGSTCSHCRLERG
jgi:hypothetical protein